jgi:diguanylate cyclase (GGDEF)-like protein
MAAHIFDLPRTRVAARAARQALRVLHVVVGQSSVETAAVAAAVRTHGRGDIAVDVVVGLGRALERLATESAALVLLQGHDADVALVALREIKHAYPALPVVLVTGDEADGAVAAVRAGAEDCLDASAASGGAVVRAIRCALERTSHAAALRTQAVTDPLTGLPNRHALQTAVGHAIARARRTGRRLAVLFLDLDGFKAVNDRDGHEQGDRVLREVARRIAGRTRDMDTVARLGGDEFVVVMEDLDNGRHAATLASKLLAAVAEPLPASGRTAALTASIGISVFPEDGGDAASLVRHADAAMYAAKAAGKQQYRYYQARFNEHARTRAELQAALQQAFREDQFELHVQPVWGATARRIVGCEALLRWRRPGHGLRLPSAFLDVADEVGLASRLTAHVVGAACAIARRMHDAGFAVPLSVNLSRRQIQEGDAPAHLRRHLEAMALDPGAIRIEVTEAVLAAPDVHVDRVLAEIAALGVRVIVDDFGSTGSLRAVQRARASAIKLEGTLVRDVPESQEADALVRAVVALAKALDVPVVAEGIETERQALALRSLGCDALQGYFYGHALPADEWLAYLRWACTAVVGSDAKPRPQPLIGLTGARAGEARRERRPRTVSRVAAAIAAAANADARVVSGRFRREH